MSKSTTSNAIAVLLTIAILVFAWKVTLPNYFAHKNNLTSLENEVSAAKAKLESIEKTKTEIAGIKSTADQITVSVPAGRDEPNLISELEAIGVKNNIVIPLMDISIPAASAASINNTGVVAQNAAAPATLTSEGAGVASGTPEATAAVAQAAAGTPFEVSFTIKGSFEDLNGFVASLEKSIRFMNIKSFTYEVLTEGAGESLALQIEIYQR